MGCGLCLAGTLCCCGKRQWHIANHNIVRINISLPILRSENPHILVLSVGFWEEESRPVALPHQPLTERNVTVSRHCAPIRQTLPSFIWFSINSSLFSSDHPNSRASSSSI